MVYSNHDLAMSEKQAADSGNKRRLNYKQLHHISPANVEKDIKAEIEDGKFNQELFRLAAVFHGYLLRCPEGSRRIHPRPASLESDTNGLMEGATDMNPEKDWIEDNTHPVTTHQAASITSAVKAAMAAALGLTYVERGSNVELAAAIGRAELQEQKTCTKYVFLYKYPGSNRVRAVRLNSEAPDASA